MCVFSIEIQIFLKTKSPLKMDFENQNLDLSNQDFFPELSLHLHLSFREMLMKSFCVSNQAG